MSGSLDTWVVQGGNQRVLWRSGIFSDVHPGVDTELESSKSLSSQASWNKNRSFFMLTFIMLIILAALLKWLHFICSLSLLFPQGMSISKTVIYSCQMALLINICWYMLLILFYLLLIYHNCFLEQLSVLYFPSIQIN